MPFPIVVNRFSRIDALKGVSAEIIAQSLNQVGPDGPAAEYVYILQGTHVCRYGNTAEGGRRNGVPQVVRTVVDAHEENSSNIRFSKDGLC